MADKHVTSFQAVLKRMAITNCHLFLTQNDGTLISASLARKFPVFTFSSGPTNSLRGASQLTNIKDGIVIDIGGTSTDVAVVVNGFPRPASAYT